MRSESALPCCSTAISSLPRKAAASPCPSSIWDWSRKPPVLSSFLAWPAAAYIEFFRTTPPLVQIVWLYYGLPLITGYDLGAFGAAAVALGLNIAAFYAEIFRHDWAPRMTNTQLSNVWDEFGNGLFSFYASGPWNIAEFRKRLPSRLQNAWMTAPMPGPNGPGSSSAGGASVVLFRSSQRKREAWLLAEYLSHPERQAKLYELTGDMPPRRASWEIPALAQSPYARAFRAQFDRVRATPKVPEWERIATEIRLTQERLVQGLLNVDQAAEELDRKADAILEKRRWMLGRAQAS